MIASESQDAWSLFLEYVGEKCSATEYTNWLEPIRKVSSDANRIVLEVPNIFVQEYLLDNYKKDLVHFLPLTASIIA